MELHKGEANREDQLHSSLFFAPDKLKIKKAPTDTTLKFQSRDSSFQISFKVNLLIVCMHMVQIIKLKHRFFCQFFLVDHLLVIHLAFLRKKNADHQPNSISLKPYWNTM